MNIVYYGLFVDNSSLLKSMFPPIYPNVYYHHSTIEFRPKNLDEMELGKKIKLPIIGRITTNDVDALLVDNPKSKNKYPHITLSTAEGVSPVKSNEAFEQHPDKIEMFKAPKFIDVTEGYFDGSKAIIK